MTSVPDVVTVFKIFLTLPVIVASAEIYFSKTKFIKNYIRSTMSKTGYDGLLILSIENERARNLDLSEIVKQFAEKMQDAESALHYFTVFGCIFWCIFMTFNVTFIL